MHDSRSRNILVSLLWAIIVIFTSCSTLPTVPRTASLPAKRMVLDNGLVLLVFSEPSLPLVNVQIIIKAGALYDPEEKSGTASLVSDLLDEGTTRRSATQIADEIEFVGGSLLTGAGEDWATASLRILKKDLSLGLDLLSDVLLHPRFHEAELERKRNETLGSFEAEKDEPGIIALKAFKELVFGAHPYHRPSEGTEESVPRISREDLVMFYDQYYRPNNIIMAVVGDITDEEALDLITRYFGSWPEKPVPEIQIPSAPSLNEKMIKLIDKDLKQANVMLGHVGIDRKNPDYYAVSVMNYILGAGGFSSRLLTEIRDNEGLAYSIHSRFGAGTYPGSFAVRFQTRNRSAQKAIDAVIGEIRRIRDYPVSQQELDEAKSYLIGSFPLRMDTTSKIANILAQVEYFDLGLDYFDRYPQLIRAITQEDVQRVARKYLDADRFVLVVVAKQDEAKISLVH
jgi:zinc protease